VPGEHGIEISKGAIARHVHFAGQRFFSWAAVVDDPTFRFVLLQYFFCSDRTYGRGYAQEVMASSVPPSAIGGTAIGQGIVFAE